MVRGRTPLGVHRPPWAERTPKALLPVLDHAVFGAAWGLANWAVGGRRRGVARWARCVIAYRGYDSRKIIEKVEGIGAKAVIPPKSNRKVQRDNDRELYKKRNLIEGAFNKLKCFRRIATRYDRKALHFKSFLYLAASLMWI